MSSKILPNYSELPEVKGMPHGCAWGLFDVDGKRDQVGTLNLLTPEVVTKAKEEISEGVSLSLNWPIQQLDAPGFGRQAPEHKIISLEHLGFFAHDDSIAINTQSGSQWDGLRHFAHQETRQYYNGLRHEDIGKTDDNGIHHWNRRGGIVGRGVLIDFVRYAKKHGIALNVPSSQAISAEDLKNAAKDQGTEFHSGDILIVRSGFTQWYDTASSDERQKHVTQGGPLIGVQADESTVAWLWDQHFAAIASDSVNFEVWPPQSPFMIHTYAIAMWGMPIGEMWDLEELSKLCEQKKRWSFFLTSSPLNVIGGVASPANALAIF